jgi:DNA-binding transcriptional MerR regulator
MSNVRLAGNEGGDALLRIGELARRSGVAAATLRAWERRYGVVQPTRGDSGYRLYSAAEVERVRAMARLVEAGVAPAEAADRLQRESERATPPPAAPRPAGVGAHAQEALLEALLAFDELAVDANLDEAIASFSTDAVLDELILPALRQLGERWASGAASVAQEHFASSILRGRLLGLARGWGAGAGPLALLACPSGELHDLGLIAFGLSLGRRGWRVNLLGGDTPAEALLECVARTGPAATVLFAREPDAVENIAPELTEIAARSQLLLAGAGGEAAADRIPAAAVLREGPVEAAALVAA